MRVREYQRAMDRAAKAVGMARITHHVLSIIRQSPNTCLLLTVCQGSDAGNLQTLTEHGGKQGYCVDLLGWPTFYQPAL